MTRGSLTTFSIANDVAKYFAIIPAAFATTYPQLQRLNIMGLTTPQSAILSAVIFNALIIIALIPLALRGVRYRAVSASILLRDNLLIYGLGGLVYSWMVPWFLRMLSDRGFVLAGGVLGFVLFLAIVLAIDWVYTVPCIIGLGIAFGNCLFGVVCTFGVNVWAD